MRETEESQRSHRGACFDEDRKPRVSGVRTEGGFRGLQNIYGSTRAVACKSAYLQIRRRRPPRRVLKQSSGFRRSGELFGPENIPLCRPFLQAAEGIRTLDLLHGKRNVGSRGSEESPAKCRFPSYRRSAMLSSLCREIAGVSGLKPDSGPRRLGRRLRSTVGSHPAPSSPLAVGRRCSCWRSSTRAAVRPPATAAADACSSPPAVTLDGARVLRSGGSSSRDERRQGPPPAPLAKACEGPRGRAASRAR
jgi:hypothetical protein